MQSINNNIGKQIDKSVTFDNHIFIDIDYICKSIEINGHNFFSRERYQVTGSPSSKYERRRASALLRNIRNIRICMGKKPFVSVTYENERISIKKDRLPYIKCVLRLYCVVHGPICGRSMGCTVNGFLSIFRAWATRDRVTDIIDFIIFHFITL